MSFDPNITVTILKDARGGAVQGFGDILLATAGAAGFAAGEIRRYRNASDAAADADLDAGDIAAVQDLFSQTVHTGSILVGKVAAYLAANFDLLAADAVFGGFYGLALASRAEADILAAAAWAEANGPRLFLAQTSDAAVLAGTVGNVGEDLAGFSYSRTAFIWSSQDGEARDLAWLAYKLAADPDITATIWNYTQLVGFATDDANIDATEQAQVEAYNGNMFLSFRGFSVAGPGTTVDGSPIDELISRDWLKARMEERLAKLLVDASALNQKIPYTEAGRGQIIAVAEEILRRGEDIGHLEPGSSVILVDDFDDVPPADKAARIMRLEAETVLAGAVERISFPIAVLTAQ